jgi:hypothetical protein
MEYTLIHALVLTPFESTLTQLDWETVAAQDYPVHVLYCKELQCILFHSDNQQSDCNREIENICALLTKMAMRVYIE